MIPVCHICRAPVGHLHVCGTLVPHCHTCGAEIGGQDWLRIETMGPDRNYCSGDCLAADPDVEIVATDFAS